MAPSRPYSPSHRQRQHLRTQNTRQPTGSATQTLTSTPEGSTSPEPPLVLRLRGAHTSQNTTDDINPSPSTSPSRRHIQWAEDVIDNEGLGRKKSKVCCIYHKPRPVGESSDESSSDSDSHDSSDGDSDRDGAMPVGGSGRGRGHNHSHSHGKRKGKRRPSPNAYEKMPKYDIKPLVNQPASVGGSGTAS